MQENILNTYLTMQTASAQASERQESSHRGDLQKQQKLLITTIGKKAKG